MINSMVRSAVTAKRWYRSMLAGNAKYNPGAYEQISTILVSTATQFLFFTNIPQDYKHLQLRMTLRTDSNSVDCYIAFNGESNSANHSYHYLLGNGSSVSSSGVASSWMVIGVPEISSSTSGAFTANIVDILDYSSPNKFTTSRSLSGGTSINQIRMFSAAWRNTAPVTEIRLNSGGGNMVTGTRVSLYGIKG